MSCRICRGLTGYTGCLECTSPLPTADEAAAFRQATRLLIHGEWRVEPVGTGSMWTVYSRLDPDDGIGVATASDCQALIDLLTELKARLP